MTSPLPLSIYRRSPLSVRFTVSLRNDQIGHCAPDRLVARPPKDVHGVIIPISYDAVVLHHNDRIKSGFKDRAQLVPPLIQAVRFRIANDCHGRTKFTLHLWTRRIPYQIVPLTASLNAEWRLGEPVFYKLLGRGGPLRPQFTVASNGYHAAWWRVAPNGLPLGCWRGCKPD
jgi:hypothetical protein